MVGGVRSGPRGAVLGVVDRERLVEALGGHRVLHLQVPPGRTRRHEGRGVDLGSRGREPGPHDAVVVGLELLELLLREVDLVELGEPLGERLRRLDDALPARVHDDRALERREEPLDLALPRVAHLDESIEGGVAQGIGGIVVADEPDENVRGEAHDEQHDEHGRLDAQPGPSRGAPRNQRCALGARCGIAR